MRYARQEKLIGSEAQKKLSKALVTIVGCGGTGSAAAEYLVRAGVNVRLIDRDIVEVSNLQRQLYREMDLGKPKAQALKQRLEGINSEIRIDAVSDDLNRDNIVKLLNNSSVILDGTDNMDTRFLINDYCLKNHVPFTYAASIKSEGMFTFILPKQGPCLRCFIQKITPGSIDTCETAGVIGPVAGLIGSISAAETIKYIIGEKPLVGNILHVNVFNNIYETIGLSFNKNCMACKDKYEFLDSPRRDVTPLCASTYQFLFENDINIGALASRMKNDDELIIINASKDLLQLQYKDYAITLFRNRMLIQNIFSERAVRTVASKIIGL